MLKAVAVHVNSGTLPKKSSLWQPAMGKKLLILVSQNVIKTTNTYEKYHDFSFCGRLKGRLETH